jgi:hypothetical protein
MFLVAALLLIDVVRRSKDSCHLDGWVIECTMTTFLNDVLYLLTVSNVFVNTAPPLELFNRFAKLYRRIR